MKMTKSESIFEKKDFLNAPYNPSMLNTRVSVIDRFQQGNSTENDEFYFFNKYKPLVIAVGRKKRMSDEDIKELIFRVFDCVFQIFKKISAGEKKEITYARKSGTQGRFRDWFSKIIRSRIADIRREQARMHECSVAPDVINAAYDSEMAPDEDFIKTWQCFILREALQELRNNIDEIHYNVFFMVKMRGEKGPRAAQIFNLSVDNVNQICSRTQKKLLTLVKELSEEHPMEKIADDEMCRYIAAVDKEFQKLDKEFLD